MLLVKTTINPSSIHGIGLFAAERISKDAPIKFHHPFFDKCLDENKLENLPPPAQEFVERFGWNDKGKIRLSLDNGRFTNHSYAPNAVLRLGTTVALRDIEVGEEITQDYSTFDPDFDDYKDELK